jgi:hypothetical protein
MSLEKNDVSKITQDSEEVKANSPAALATDARAFDISGAVTYLRTIGFDAATPNFIRGLVARGQVPHVKVGKKFYVTRAALDGWLSRSEGRRR